MVTLSNNKVTHTWTISNATVYSRYMWKASPMEAVASMAAPCHACQSSSMTINFHHRSIQNRHRIARIMRLLWRTIFHHKFVTKLKLWRIWLLQWRKLFIIEVDISSSLSLLNHPPNARTATVSGEWVVLHLLMVPHVISMKVESKASAEVAPTQHTLPFLISPSLSKRQEQGRTRVRR